MKKTLRKAICALLCAVLLAGAFSCTGRKPTEKEREQTVSDGKNYLVEKGETDYAVLLRPEHGKAERYAADELIRLVEEASGAELPVVTAADLSVSTKYISIGGTEMAEKAGVSVSVADLTRNGFRIKTYKDGLVIHAPNESGLIYGVYRFLEKNCDYMYYAPGEYKIDRSGTLPLKTFDYEDWPDFLNRDVYNYDTREFPANTMRLYLTGSNYSVWEEKYGEGQWWSTLHDQSLVFQLVDFKRYRPEHPDWYCGGDGSSAPENPQICYTTGLYDKDAYEKGDWSEHDYNDGRHGLFWTLVYNLIHNYIAVETDKSLFQLGMSDNSVYCDCARCRDDVKKFGRSGTALRFVNAVADEVEKWRLENCPERDIYLTMFAYVSIVDPPTRIENGKYVPLDPSVVARDNVVIRYAPIDDFYMYPLMDEENNPGARNALLGWSAVAKHLAVWDYRVNFTEMLLPFPQWMSAYENIKTYRDLGFIDVFHQGCRTFGGTPFIAMDNWVRARLLWNVDQDYDALTDEFIDAYYGPAGDCIREYMEYLTMHYLSHLRPSGYKGHSHRQIINARNFPRGFALNVEDIFDRAYAAIEPLKSESPERYAALKTRVDGETLFYRYTLIQLYGHFYDRAELTAMIDEFERIADEVRFLGMQTVDQPIAEIIGGWRAAL